ARPSFATSRARFVELASGLRESGLVGGHAQTGSRPPATSLREGCRAGGVPFLYDDAAGVHSRRQRSSALAWRSMRAEDRLTPRLYRAAGCVPLFLFGSIQPWSVGCGSVFG